MPTFSRSIDLAAPATEVFAWHEDPAALPNLSPAFPRLELVQHEGIQDGALTILRVGVGPLRMTWQALHSSYVQGRQFRDTQIAGPFRQWVHTHTFVPTGSASMRMTDTVEYEIGGPRWLRSIAQPIVSRMLRQMFRHRHAVLAAAFEGRGPVSRAA